MNLSPRDQGGPRILLFSDLHLGRIPTNLRQIRGKRWQGILNHQLLRRWRVRKENLFALARLLPELSPDLVLCGGDLTSVALPEEFAEAREALQPILDWCGPDRFCYLPGNHDLYVEETASRRALEESFAALNAGRWTRGELPVMFRTGDVEICLLDAARPVPWFRSYGVVDERMQTQFQECLKRMTAPHRIVFSHFPVISERGGMPDGRHGILGAECVREALEKGQVEAVVSGHVHHPYQVQLPSGGWQFCCGSLTMAGSFLLLDFQKTLTANILNLKG